MQHVTHDAPAWFVTFGASTQNPVFVESVDFAGAALELIAGLQGVFDLKAAIKPIRS